MRREAAPGNKSQLLLSSEEADMNDLYAWVAQQHHGLHTFKSFQDKLARLAEEQPRQRGLCRVLTHLVQGYIEAFDEAPVPVELASDVHHRLAQLLSTLDLNGDADRRLADINRIASFALWPLPDAAAPSAQHRPG
ncbi:hypothetical protein [Rhodopseudomonas palustris]|uniref:hypothetical protein n=1 Tax=Rhodopseudomonas palustris TaxID=1076 RepID=UPI0034E949E9